MLKVLKESIPKPSNQEVIETIREDIKQRDLLLWLMKWILHPSKKSRNRRIMTSRPSECGQEMAKEPTPTNDPPKSVTLFNSANTRKEIIQKQIYELTWACTCSKSLRGHVQASQHSYEP